MPRTVAYALALAALAACSRASEPANPPPAAPAPPAAAPEPKPPPTLSALLAEAVAVQPDGTEVSLLGEGAQPVDPASAFRLVLRRRLPDLRLSLFEGDAMVAAEGHREVAEGTTVTLKPSAVLQAQAAYRLRLDGASTREAHDEAGNAFEPLHLEVRTGGAPPPPPEKPARKRRR